MSRAAEIAAVIGGSGLEDLQEWVPLDETLPETPYGLPSAPLLRGRCAGRETIFLARHGRPHLIPPHEINYRANLWALREQGATQVIAVNAVGGIAPQMRPGRIVIPDQLIDYTWGRAASFWTAAEGPPLHVDFTHPYSAALRRELLAAGRAADLQPHDGGAYGATQGPRLESAAEIRRLRRDGCDIVGMTGMPEAALARELELPYACCALVSNWAAGCASAPPNMERIRAQLQAAIGKVQRLLKALFAGAAAE
ncbi:MAG: S-methyl-5'-thioinosine phosphorylase [Gammaproteobacteria bacterium]|nr:S-methyl-5'-thioinosine phosphorylase [Gammaproteobacteria bacterium]